MLAGGTATRLFPLTIVTNKHLLPIYDRPMIYYPLETLAGMGIREVMVIVGGKSVGDIVELLADGAHFGLDLTYRYQRGALGIAHAIGLARDWIGDDAFCVVLGDNILRGPALEDVAQEFDAGAAGAGTLLYRVPDPQRFGVAELDAAGNVIGFEEKPQHPKSDLIPIGVYFLRPDAFDVIDHLAPSGRGEFEITDVLNHYIPEGRLFTRVYDGHWADAGTVPSLLRAAALANDDDEAGAAHATGREARGVTPRDRLPPAPRHGRRRVHRQRVRPPGPGAWRRHHDHRPRQADLRGQPGEPPAAGRPPRPADRLLFVEGDIADPTVAEPLVGEADAVVNFAAESHVDRSILDPEAFLRTGVIGVHVLLEAVRRASAGRDTPLRFLQVSTDEVYGTLGADDPHWTEDSPIQPRSPTPPRRPPASCSSGATSSPTESMPSSPGARTPRPVPAPREAHPPHRPTPSTTSPCRCTAMACSIRDWLHVSDHAGGIDFVLRHGRAGEAYNVPGGTELPNREVLTDSSPTWASRGRWFGACPIGPATTGAMR